MDYIELLKMKGNIFDHILYEFQMYIETYIRLMKHIQENNDDVILKNIYLESHAVHLRNLIEFFNQGDNCLTTKTIFAKNPDMRFDDSKIQAKKVVNKAIDHLTKERYTLNQTEQDLTVRYGIIIHTLFANIIMPRIKDSVELLQQESEVNSEHLEALRNSGIQERLQQLAEFCNKFFEVSV